MADPLAFLVRGRPITAEVLRDYGNVLLHAADQMAKGQLTVSEASVIIEKTAPLWGGCDRDGTDASRAEDAELNHRSFNDCLNDPDPCISWFDGTGSAYCHHCKSTQQDAREKAKHARCSTMETPNVAAQPEAAVSKPQP